MQFADLDNPLAAQVHRHVLAGARDVRQVVAEVVAARHTARARLESALGIFQDHHVVGFATGSEHPRHHRDEQHAPDSLRVRAVLGTEEPR
jgi:hypothetical protein